MAVNANSVIPVWINSWRPDFYTAITSMEDWSYTNSSLTNWKPIFQNLATAMTSYQQFNRQDELTNFYFGTYGYFCMGTLYGLDQSLAPTLDSQLIYNMAGFVGTTLVRPVDYYNDWVAATPPAVGGSSAKMTADIATVSGANASETALIGNRASSTLPEVKQLQVQLLFQDLPVDGNPTKVSMVTQYFETLHWKEAYQLNVGNLILPPGA